MDWNISALTDLLIPHMTRGRMLVLGTSILMGLALAFGCFNIERHDNTPPRGALARRYGSNAAHIYILAFFTFAIPMFTLALGWKFTFSRFFPWGVGVFFQISIFYALLVPLSPLLRRRFTARSCAYLWLVPGFLFMPALYRSWHLPRPLLILSPPAGVLYALFGVWAAGFFGVLGWHILDHFRFRRSILRDARKVTDRDILRQWQAEQIHANYEKDFPLLISPAVTTPLTIGLFSWSICVVLPQVDYTREELRLIFRHEMVHICREDSWNKVYLLLCTAALWFNPLMWRAMKGCAEDLELSCDETVLLLEDNPTRRLYAELILSSAGNGRGFTTCLSAAADSMRYRLGMIVRERQTVNGGLLLGFALFILFMTNGFITVAVGQGAMAPALFPDPQGEYYIADLSYGLKGETQDITQFDGEGLIAYLSQLEGGEISIGYPFPSDGLLLCMSVYGPEGRALVDITDDTLHIFRLYKATSADREQLYHLTTPVDWAYVEPLLGES